MLLTHNSNSELSIMLTEAQKAPVHIREYGKTVAVLLSASDYQRIEQLKLELLQERAKQSDIEYHSETTVPGKTFFQSLLNSDDDL